MHVSVERAARQILIQAVLAAWMSTARAALGGDAASIALDAARLHGQLQPPAPLPGTTVTISVDNGMTVREFMDARGTVFAVSWSGPAVPDLQELLGRYFVQYAAALRSLPNPGRQRAIHVATADLVVESAGQLRAYAGRAYLPAALPAGLALERLR